jgi:TatD DNase family protein
LWKELLVRARFIGEVGLDAGPSFYPSFTLQKQVFAEQLRACSVAGDKVLTVHSVRAAGTVLDMHEEHLPPNRGRVVLHWFTGNHSDARRAIELGCYFSINAEMLRSARHRATIAKLPLSQLLTETDGPFTLVNGRVSVPRDVAATVQTLAQLRAIGADDLAGAIRANLARLLSGYDTSPGYGG